MFQKIEKQVRSLLEKSVECYLADSFPAASSLSLRNILEDLVLEIPKEKEFGDLSSSISLKLARPLAGNPKTIADGIASKLKDLTEGSSSCIKKVEVKGAGFLNIFLKDEVFLDLLKSINKEGANFAKFDLGENKRLLLEFVSANPTGPLSVAHARQAAVGDTLGNVLEMAGYEVVKEYYLNDEGHQINILGRSLLLRWRQLCGEQVDFPDDYYQGPYILDLAKGLTDDKKACGKIERLPDAEKEKFFVDYGVEKILRVIKKELEDFGVRFDGWYSQKALGASGKIEKTLDDFKKKDYLFEADGAVWFKSSAFGDDKDRVVRKSDGSYTYLAPDIAYHRDKFKRGFDRVINIWGPDHHGYIPRMKAAVQALGEPESAFSVIIVQLATLFRQGEPVPMSTRRGQYVTLRQVLTEVGLDAARFFFLMRKTDSHLDFDVELAKKQTPDNPVYYIQYAHARIAGILAAASPLAVKEKAPDFSLLKEEEEWELMRSLFGFSYCLEVCARQLDPYTLTVYLASLATAFHRFYDKHKVLSDHETLTGARLFLIRAVKIVLACGLRLAGVSSPEKM